MQIKLVSDQESKHWFVCRAQQTSKVFVLNKLTGNLSTVKLCWMAAVEASMFALMFCVLHPVFTGVFSKPVNYRITSGSYVQKIRTKAQEIQATDFKYH